MLESAFWFSLQENGKTPSQLLQDTAAFADDQIIARLQITLDNFRVGAVVETE